MHAHTHTQSLIQRYKGPKDSTYRKGNFTAHKNELLAPFPPTNPQKLDTTLLYFSAIFNLFQFFGAFIVSLAS